MQKQQLHTNISVSDKNLSQFCTAEVVNALKCLCRSSQWKKARNQFAVIDAFSESIYFFVVETTSQCPRSQLWIDIKILIISCIENKFKTF